MKAFVQAGVLAIVVTLASSATLTSAASAETMLLAEWLLNGESVAEPHAATVSGGVLLEDTETIAGAASVLCQVTIDGTVGSDGSGQITEVLNANSEKISELGGLALLGTGAASGEGSECQAVKTCAAGTATSPIEVWPVGTPWGGELHLMENGEFLGLASSSTGEKVVGYELLCLVLGIDTEDRCTLSDVEGAVANSAETGDAGTPTGSEATPHLNCSQSGKASGRGVSDLVWEIIIGGLLLTVSSE